MQKDLGGYTDKADIERDIKEASNLVADIETQIKSAHSNVGTEYNLEEALNIYLNEPKIAAIVNAIYPVACFFSAMLGKTNTIIFGRYIQKNNGTPEPIEWQVLARENGRMLIITKYALDCQEYNTTYTDVSWGSCSLRKWLNGGFYSTAFSSEKQKNIVCSSHRNNTTDKVFLLSSQEAYNYFNSDSARKCHGTTYSNARGLKNANNGYCGWWLKSLGEKCLQFVDADGMLYSTYDFRFRIKYGVRPAMWIDLSS